MATAVLRLTFSTIDYRKNITNSETSIGVAIKPVSQNAGRFEFRAQDFMLRQHDICFDSALLLSDAIKR